MANLRSMTLASLIGLSMGAALAQPAGGPGPMGANQAASAPGAGMGMGMAAKGGQQAARWGSSYTPGWTLMTQEERNEHRSRMLSMKTYEECKAYQDQHREQMAARAKERGGKALPTPRRDACANLKK
jgi:hypothetical protein